MMITFRAILHHLSYLILSPEPALISRLMTQRYLDLGEDWTEDDHRTAHASLSYEYRVVCQAHYYGEGCRKWCRPRNDSFGHYMCNDTGHIVCLEGWQGTQDYCITRKYLSGINTRFRVIDGMFQILIFFLHFWHKEARWCGLGG